MSEGDSRPPANTGSGPNPATPPRAGDDPEDIREQTEREGGEGGRNAETAPRITDDSVPGQTQSPAPADDVGVPPDEELGGDDG